MAISLTQNALTSNTIEAVNNPDLPLHQGKTIQQEIIQAIPDLVWLKDSHGRYIFCNQSFAEFFGVSAQQVIGERDGNFLPSQLAKTFHRHDQEVISSGNASTQEQPILLPYNTQQSYLEITRVPMCSPQGGLRGVLGIGHNITSRKALEIRQQDSAERFSLAMRGANDGLWDWNLETNEVYYSPRWKNMLGYGPNELGNDFDTWANLVNPEDKAIALAKVQDYILGRETTFEVEMRMRHRNGHDVFVLSRAFLVHRQSDQKPIRLVGTHVDITDRKESEIFNNKNAEILKMIATGKSASSIYDEIALMYEARNPGMRCSMLELNNGHLLHGGAPSLPKVYCQAVHGLKYGPEVGSCGTSTYTGKRVLVENIETDPKWADIKHIALPHGMRCCWSEPIKNSLGEVLGAFGMYYDYPALPNENELNDLISAARLAGIVMERDQAQRQIHELAYTDTLTKLASRAYFYQVLEETVAAQKSCSLLYLDLDDFKCINDSLGHDAGDLLLQEVAKRLEGVACHNNFVARLSGDEFCLLVKESGDRLTAEKLAHYCLTAIAQPVKLDGRTVIPACSIGIAHYPSDAKDPVTLLKAADTSLYAAKEKGKNQYAFYQPEFTQQAEYRFQVEQCLRGAVEQEELSLVYQPQVHLETGKIIGVEALARWSHPQLGEVSPGEFIAIAEKIGMIKPLTEWVLKTACNQMVSWMQMGFPSLNVAVNISAQHFLDDDFVDLVQHILEKTGMPACHLELEVTESVVQTDIRNLKVFQDLKDLGVLIAIDDFGTGYSSFASLKHITVDYLKLDKYFIDDMITDPKSRTLVVSMVEMGHNLGQGIIAEGVETVAQYDMLRRIGCEMAQGYLFSKPIDANGISKLMRRNLDRGKHMWSEQLVA